MCWVRRLGEGLGVGDGGLVDPLLPLNLKKKMMYMAPGLVIKLFENSDFQIEVREIKKSEVTGL